MGTIQPRARGGASLGAKLREGQDDRQQIRRLFTAPPKPAAVAGAGLIGNAEAASSTYATDGNYGLKFNSWTFTRHDYWPGDGAPTLAEVSAGSKEFDPSEAGWYQAHAHVTLYVSGGGGVPPFVRVEVNPDSNMNTDAISTDERALLTDGSSRFVHTVVPTAPFYHPGPGEGNHFLGVALSWPGTSGVVVQSASVSYLLTRVR